MRREYKNKPEEQFCQFAESQGYSVTKRGWPDFFCVKNGEFIAVEVKPKKYTKLKNYQLTLMAHLVSKGIKCYRWDPESRNLTPIEKLLK